MKVVLAVLSGPRKGEKKVFDEPDLFTVGRQEDCHFYLRDDPYLSRHHFLLEISPPEVFLQDLHSTNGTWVNEVCRGGRGPQGQGANEGEASRVELKDGDTIKVGRTQMLVQLDAPPRCIECQSEIAAEDKEAEFIGGTHLCPPCREAKRKKAEARLIPPPAVIPPAPVQIKAPPAPSPPAQRPPAPSPPVRRPPAPNPPAQRPPAEPEPAQFIEKILKMMQAQAGGQGAYPTIAGYRILKQLGEGGFGAVYLAVEERSQRQMALKTMLQTRSPNAKALDMFEREIEINCSLRHPHIIQVQDHGCSQGIHYFALELMEAGSVWDLMLQGQRALPLTTALPIMEGALEGLAHAHAQEIIHRDLKPPNILLSRGSGTLVAKVSDFGLAKIFTRAGLTRNRITEMGSFCGSPPYIAPEHILDYRNLRPVTDVFEMAATFYHMLAGRTVWDIAGKRDMLRVILESRVKPIATYCPALPRPLADWLDKALHVDSSQRYDNAGAMLGAFRRAV